MSAANAGSALRPASAAVAPPAATAVLVRKLRRVISAPSTCPCLDMILYSSHARQSVRHPYRATSSGREQRGLRDTGSATTGPPTSFPGTVRCAPVLTDAGSSNRRRLTGTGRQGVRELIRHHITQRRQGRQAGAAVTHGVTQAGMRGVRHAQKGGGTQRWRPLRCGGSARQFPDKLPARAVLTLSSHGVVWHSACFWAWIGTRARAHSHHLGPLEGYDTP